MRSRDVDRFLDLLRGCRPRRRQEILRRLRAEFPIHQLESRIGLPAELILEAIERADPLVLRGIRGVVAELAFGEFALPKLTGWEHREVAAGAPFDFEVHDPIGSLRIQVKLQRSEGGGPRIYKSGLHCVETQKTRKGVDPETGADTRPYRFGEFDLLAVCMQPSTGQWDSFVYTVERWLTPKKGSQTQLASFQHVSPQPNDDWTDDFTTCVSWFRSNVNKTISR
jgi:hypothetical protein